MAIDLMVMPMSRYIAGDYVTPAMRLAWKAGAAYVILGPAGKRELPPDEPLGGRDAPERRRALLPMLADDLRALEATIGRPTWDELSDVEPRIHRIDPVSYEALVEQARARAARPSFLAWVKRAQPSQPHLSSSLFLPCDLGAPFEMQSPFARRVGSVAGALQELELESWADAAASARETMLAALRDARELTLPMIVDW